MSVLVLLASLHLNAADISDAGENQAGFNVSVCELVANHGKYSSQYVNVTGALGGIFEGFFLGSRECPHVRVKLSISDENAKHPSVVRLLNILWNVGGIGTGGKSVSGTFSGTYEYAADPLTNGTLILDTVPEMDVKFYGNSQDIIHDRSP